MKIIFMWKGSFKNAENKMIMGNNEKRIDVKVAKYIKNPIIGIYLP